MSEFKVQTYCNFSACGHGDSCALDLFQGIYNLGLLFRGGLVHMAIGAPAHLATLKVKQVFHALTRIGRLLLKFIVHLGEFCVQSIDIFYIIIITIFLKDKCNYTVALWQIKDFEIGGRKPMLY